MKKISKKVVVILGTHFGTNFGGFSRCFGKDFGLIFGGFVQDAKMSQIDESSGPEKSLGKVSQGMVTPPSGRTDLGGWICEWGWK